MRKTRSVAETRGSSNETSRGSFFSKRLSTRSIPRIVHRWKSRVQNVIADTRVRFVEPIARQAGQRHRLVDNTNDVLNQINLSRV